MQSHLQHSLLAVTVIPSLLSHLQRSHLVIIRSLPKIRRAFLSQLPLLLGPTDLDSSGRSLNIQNSTHQTHHNQPVSLQVE